MSTFLRKNKKMSTYTINMSTYIVLLFNNRYIKT